MFISQIDFGPEDAAMGDDPDFLKKFIDPEEIKILLSDKYWVISGEKGSGKTALRRAYSVEGTDYYDNFSTLVQITYDDLELDSFKPLLEQLEDRSKVAQLTLLANCWEYIILNEVVEEVKGQGFFFSPTSLSDTQIEEFRADIHGSDSNTEQKGVSETIMRLLERMFELLIEREGAREPLVGIRTFPTQHPGFSALIDKLADFLTRENKRVLVILDGFDHLIADYKARQHVQRVFEGLVTAVYAFALRRRLQGRFFVKALIPYDRFVSLNLRDMDKIQSLHLGIRWDRSLLRKFIDRRIRVQLPEKQTRSQNFDQLWKSLVCDTVLNREYDLVEDSFDYVLRHTMWRPRHLQIHLKLLREKFPNQKVNQDMLRDSVTASCLHLVKFFIQEFEIDHPDLDSLLNLFRNQTNVLAYEELYALVDAAPTPLRGPLSVEEKILALYKIGFFGVYEALSGRHDPHHGLYAPPRKSHVAPYRFRFYYNAPTHQGLSFSSDTIIAVHPIFFHRCRFTPHPEMIVG